MIFYEDERNEIVRGIPYYYVSLFFSIGWMVCITVSLILYNKGYSISSLLSALSMFFGLTSLAYTIFYGDCIRLLKESEIFNMKSFSDLDLFEGHKDLETETVDIFYSIILTSQKRKIELKRVFIQIMDHGLPNEAMIVYTKDMYKKNKIVFNNMRRTLLYKRYQEYLLTYEGFRVKAYSRACMEIPKGIFKHTCIYRFLFHLFDDLKESNEQVSNDAIKYQVGVEYINTANIFDNLIYTKSVSVDWRKYGQYIFR